MSEGQYEIRSSVKGKVEEAVIYYKRKVPEEAEVGLYLKYEIIEASE